MITSTDLEYMKEVEESAMGSSGTIYRATFGTSVLGNQSETWSAIGTVICDIWPINRTDRERLSEGLVLSESDYFISFPVGTDITISDIVENEAQTYQMTFVPKVTWQTNLRTEAKNYNNRSIVKG